MSEGASHMDYVQNYLGERLSEAERDAFEEQLVTDPGLVRELETTLRLREGLAMLRDRKQLVTRRPRRVRIATVAAACGGILLASMLYIGLRSAQLAPPVMAASLNALESAAKVPLAVAKRYVFTTARAASPPPIFDLPTGGALELQALTSSTDPASSFHLRLERRENQKTLVVGSLKRLVPDADGFVAAYVDASALRPGDYLLVVEPEAENTLGAEQFAFGVTSSAGSGRLN
jgi:hypothetical protein